MNKILIFVVLVISVSSIYATNITDLLEQRNQTLAALDQAQFEIDEIIRQSEQGLINQALMEEKIQEQLRIIAQLQWDLEVAVDRIMDAEDGAIALLDQNTELYSQNRAMERLTADLRREVARMERRDNLQPYVMLGHGVAFTVGGTFMGMGLAGMSTSNSINDFIDNKAFTTGCIIVGTTALVYVAGRWIFRWW